ARPTAAGAAAVRYWAVVLFSLMQAAWGEPVAITGATLWTGTASEPVKNATILIADGRIVAVGAGRASPASARVINAQRKVVTARLEARARQIGRGEGASAMDIDARAVQGGPPDAAFDAPLGVDLNDLPIQAARAAGVAHALVFPGPASSGIFAGE